MVFWYNKNPWRDGSSSGTGKHPGYYVGTTQAASFFAWQSERVFRVLSNVISSASSKKQKQPSESVAHTAQVSAVLTKVSGKSFFKSTDSNHVENETLAHVDKALT